MEYVDEIPANAPRVLSDGELKIEKGRVPVLISAGNRRLVVLQSQSLYEMQPGQQGVLSGSGRPTQHITITALDRLALVVSYDVDQTLDYPDDMELPPLDD